MKEILSEADKVKDGIYCPANPRLFGNFIKQLGGEKLRLVKRGSKTQRQNFYLDLRLKSPVVEKIDTNDLAEEIPPLKSGWHLVVDDRELSLIRHELWSFKNQRVTTEVRVEMQGESNSMHYSIASHGNETDLKQFIDMDCLQKHTANEQIKMVLTIVESSKLCRGVSTGNGELVTMLPYESGKYAGRNCRNSPTRIICFPAHGKVPFTGSSASS